MRASRTRTVVTLRFTTSAERSEMRFKQINVAQHLIRFRGDRKIQALALGHFFEDRARRAEFALGRLIRVGCGADGDVFAPDFLGGEIALG